MKVVLDSNIIIADWHLDSPTSKILLESSKKGNLVVYIPQIVLDEVINKFEQRLIDAKNKINKELGVVGKLLRQNLESELTNEIIEKSCKRYEKNLLKKIKENKITVLKYPKTEHSFLTYKAMKKIRPFNTNEKGYRDCLIWENIKNLLTVEVDAATFPEVVLVTANYKDFAGDDSKLHQDLKDELIAEDYNEQSVELCRTLAEFNDERIKLFLTQSETFRNRIKENQIWNFDIKTPILNYLFDNYVGEELWSFDIDIDDEYDSPTISQINDEDFEIDIESVKKLNATEYILDVKSTIDSGIEFFVERYSSWIEREPKITILDSDWNRHVMLASSNIQVPVSLSLIVNTNMEIASIEINKINDRYLW